MVRAKRWPLLDTARGGIGESAASVFGWKPRSERRKRFKFLSCIYMSIEVTETRFPFKYQTEIGLSRHARHAAIYIFLCEDTKSGKAEVFFLLAQGRSGEKWSLPSFLRLISPQHRSYVRWVGRAQGAHWKDPEMEDGERWNLKEERSYRDRLGHSTKLIFVVRDRFQSLHPPFELIKETFFLII